MVHITDKTFPQCIKEYNEHPLNCMSREDMWMGYSGGFTSMSETYICDICQHTFWFNATYFDDMDIPYCECCLRLKDKNLDKYVKVLDETIDDLYRNIAHLKKIKSEYLNSSSEDS